VTALAEVADGFDIPGVGRMEWVGRAESVDYTDYGTAISASWGDTEYSLEWTIRVDAVKIDGNEALCALDDLHVGMIALVRGVSRDQITNVQGAPLSIRTSVVGTEYEMTGRFKCRDNQGLLDTLMALDRVKRSMLSARA
jgi:hypothetical protein